MTTRDPFDPTALRVGADLRRLGVEPSRAGWHQVRRGVWLPPGAWAGLSRDQQYEALVFATLLTCREPQSVVLAAHSAAAVWGMPAVEPWPTYVHAHDPDGAMGPSRHIRPRHGTPTEPVRVRGVPVTPPARTVIDLACVGSLDTALAAADHALRTGLCSREELEEEVGVLRVGARGRVAARLVVDLADGLSGFAG